MSAKSPLLFSQISKWLNACIESHQNCHLESPSILPKRVIDVGTSEGPQDPYLSSLMVSPESMLR